MTGLVASRALAPARLRPPAPRPLAAAGALPPLVFGLLLTGVLLRLLVSANLLAAAGIPYAQDGGNPLVKIHPGTWAVMLGLGAEWLAGPQPPWAGGRGRPALFLAALAVCLLYGLAVSGPSGLAVYADSYVCAAAAALLMVRASAPQRRALGRALLGAILVSAALALGETFAGRHLVPHMAEIVELTEAHAAEFRGMGLHDHPLVGALASMVGLFLAPALGLGRAARRGAVLVLAASLLAFGGRAALAVSLAMALACGARLLWRRAAAGRLGPGTLLALLLLPPLAAVLGAVLAAETPLGQRLLLHLMVDDSVLARGAQWQVLGALTWRQAMLGASIDEVRQILFQLSRAVPLTEIENFWLATFVSLGAVGFLVFLAGFVPFLAWLWRVAPGWGRVILASGILVASTSNTLGRKSDVLVMIVVAVLATMRPAVARAA